MANRCNHPIPELSLLPVATSVVWVGCLIVGTTGLLFPVLPTKAVRKIETPIVAQLMHVDLAERAPSQADLNQRHSAATPPDSTPPPPPPAVASPASPPMASVASPSAAVAFAVPTSGPSKISSAELAIPTKSADRNTAAGTAVQRIVYGQGEGQQIKPDYPPEAKIAREQGTVIVRFTITEDGSVSSAEAVKPSPYALLNQSAVRTIREEWRFSPGPVRVKEIAIEFNLREH